MLRWVEISCPRSSSPNVYRLWGNFLQRRFKARVKSRANPFKAAILFLDLERLEINHIGRDTLTATAVGNSSLWPASCAGDVRLNHLVSFLSHSALLASQSSAQPPSPPSQPAPSSLRSLSRKQTAHKGKKILTPVAPSSLTNTKTSGALPVRAEDRRQVNEKPSASGSSLATPMPLRYKTCKTSMRNLSSVKGCVGRSSAYLGAWWTSCVPWELSRFPRDGACSGDRGC